MQPSRRSQRGLDWFAFFLADVQTGWGPFVAAYLTSVAWAQLDIGILTIGTLTGLAMQIPVGALVDRAPEWATPVLAICILAPQFLVAAIAPWVGRKAQSWGRRPLLASCFVALSIRGTVFAATSEPYVIVAAQLLDGISAATLGVLVPLVIADTTRGSGHFNFAQGVVGVAVGIGASISTTLAGYIADASESVAAFLSLAGVGAVGLALVLARMPETRDAPLAFER